MLAAKVRKWYLYFPFEMVVVLKNKYFVRPIHPEDVAIYKKLTTYLLHIYSI